MFILPSGVLVPAIESCTAQGASVLNDIDKNLTDSTSKAGISGRVMGGKIDSWNGVGAKKRFESSMSHKMVIFKAGIDFVLGYSPPPPPPPPPHAARQTEVTPISQKAGGAGPPPPPGGGRRSLG
jgi:hypothetical protein